MKGIAAMMHYSSGCSNISRNQSPSHHFSSLLHSHFPSLSAIHLHHNLALLAYTVQGQPVKFSLSSSLCYHFFITFGYFSIHVLSNLRNNYNNSSFKTYKACRLHEFRPVIGILQVNGCEMVCVSRFKTCGNSSKPQQSMKILFVFRLAEL